MIVAKKIQSKKIKKTQLNTIKQIYKGHFHMNDIRKKFPTTLFENNARKFKLKLCTTVI